MNPEITPELVLEAYRIGVFPMADPDGSLYWYSPDPRCIFDLDKFHVPKSLRPKLNQPAFETRIDHDFAAVIQACANRREGTWISPEIAELYLNLHTMGYAHSVETWHDDTLVGGLYGVALAGAFFGESMFHTVTDASKVALVRLVERLRARGFTLLDTQWSTPHLERFGAIEIPRSEYLHRLSAALAQDCQFVD